MKKVLIIAQDYPPTNEIGAIRIAKYAKYLPEYGWQPIVLTGSAEYAYKLGQIEDPLNGDRVYRTKDININRLLSKFAGLFIRNNGEPVHSIAVSKDGRLWSFFLMEHIKNIYRNLLYWPDPFFLWYFSAAKKAVEIAQKEKVDVIFSSSNPPTCHLVASHVARKTGISWVAEFRDLWTHNSKWHQWKLLQHLKMIWEKRTLLPSKAIVTVSALLSKTLEQLHRKHTFVVYNGFDQDDFPKEAILYNPKLTIRYTGKIYIGKRDPTILFQALADMKTKGELSEKDLCVEFYSSEDNFISALSNKYGIEEFVKVYTYVPYDRSLYLQKASDVLLLLEQDEGAYTGKFYEYLGAARPILAIVSERGVIKEALAETSAGIVVTTKDDAQSVIIKWINEFRQYGKIGYNGNIKLIHEKFSRASNTQKLANLFDEISSGYNGNIHNGN